MFKLGRMPAQVELGEVPLRGRDAVAVPEFAVRLKALFLKGAGLRIIGNQLLFMAAFAAIVYWLAVRKLKRQKVD